MRLYLVRHRSAHSKHHDHAGVTTFRHPCLFRRNHLDPVSLLRSTSMEMPAEPLCGFVEMKFRVAFFTSRKTARSADQICCKSDFVHTKHWVIATPLVSLSQLEVTGVIFSCTRKLGKVTSPLLLSLLGGVCVLCCGILNNYVKRIYRGRSVFKTTYGLKHATRFEPVKKTTPLSKKETDVDE